MGIGFILISLSSVIGRVVSSRRFSGKWSRRSPPLPLGTYRSQLSSISIVGSKPVLGLYTEPCGLWMIENNGHFDLLIFTG